MYEDVCRFVSGVDVFQQHKNIGPGAVWTAMKRALNNTSVLLVLDHCPTYKCQPASIAWMDTAHKYLVRTC